MRRTAHAKSINIMSEAVTIRVERGLHGAHAGGESGRVVDTLGAGDDFLASHEGVVGMGEVGRGGGEVGVEGAGGGGVVG